MDSKKLNIAVVFEGDLTVGGGYQQQLSTILKLKELKKYNFIGIVFSEENKKALDSYGIKNILLKNSFWDKVVRLFLRQEWSFYLSNRFKIKTSFEKKILQYNIDLVYFLSPSTLSLDLVCHNYIITVWDLCHRDNPEFPEVNYYREFERREFLYNRSLKKAVAVIVDSKLGKSNVIKRYGVDEERVFVVPFSPSINAFSKSEIDVRNKYGITGDYIFYPAQFWAHKNHVYIIDALSILKADGMLITAVFSGSDKGNLEYVLNYSKSKNVDDLVKYIGFVPNEEIYPLYKNALALVMPTYFGPTNIPPLEAFAIGTPVIVSDIPGFREQLGDAALFCDLKNPKSLAEALKLIIKDSKYRDELIQKGRKRLEEISQIDLTNVLERIFDDYAVKLKCWKNIDLIR
ncbi:MAG: glycosyltransferase family 4 protein [Thermoanaerobacteraceae bacterium]